MSDVCAHAVEAVDRNENHVTRSDRRGRSGKTRRRNVGPGGRGGPSSYWNAEVEKRAQQGPKQQELRLKTLNFCNCCS